MPRSAPAVAALGLLIALSIFAPSASALIVEGHSPITILLTSPDSSGSNQFGCTSSGCICTNSSPCTVTDTANDFVNKLPSSECAPTCVYFVDSGTSDTVIGIPNPTTGTWTVTFFGTLGSGQTGTFTITANTCQTDQSQGSGGDSVGSEARGSCSVFCTISDSSPAHVLCDADDNPVSTITVTTGTATGTQSGSGGIFSVSSSGVPFLPPTGIPTPEFGYGYVGLVGVLFLGLVIIRRRRAGTD